MKFKEGDIVVARNKKWLVAIGNELYLNCWKIVGIDCSSNHYLILHQEDWCDETAHSSRWSCDDFEENFEIDIKKFRKKKLNKLYGI